MNRTAPLLFAYVAVAVALLVARPPATPGPLARDFEAYWAAGGAWNAHADPYAAALWRFERAVPGVDARHEELLPFIGPPGALVFWSCFARLPYPLAAAIWEAFLAAALLALVVMCARAGGRAPGGLTIAAALALAVAFGPITSDLALGQLALPAFAGAVLLVVGAEGAFPVAIAGAVAAFAQPNVALGLTSQLGRNRATPALIAGAIVTYGLGAAAAGWSWPARYLHVLAAHGAAERFSAIQMTPAAIAFGFGATPPASLLAAAVAGAAAAVAAITLGLRIPQRYARFAAWSALAPFASLFWHEHDLLVAYPAALWSAQRTSGATRAVALAGTLLVAVDWLGLAQRPGGILQSALLALAACAAFISLRVAPARAIATVALASAAIFALAAWLAHAHPAPVWPTAMSAFHPPASASAAQIWQAEQRASGLLAPVAAWSLLRALSLLGCALLAYAIYRHSSSGRTA